MKRHAKASSAGSNHGTGSARGLFRRAFVTRGASGDSKGSGAPAKRSLMAVPMIAAVAVLVSLVFGVGAASAAPPTVTFNPTDVGYTTAKVNMHFDVPTGSPGYVFESYLVQYAIDPDVEGWQGEYFLGGSLSSFDGGVEITGLKPDTTYKYRVVMIGVFNGGDYEFVSVPEFPGPGPYPTFTTKHVNAPVVTLDPITTFTTTTAHITGTVDANAPAGPYTPAQEAAYETSWHFECEPVCANPAKGVVKAGEGPQPAVFDAKQLETNTIYQVKLVATNGGGFQETVAERTFSTPLVLPTVKSAPGAPDGKSGYTLEGVVNPLGSSISSCRFEYGPTAAYVFQAQCSPVPVGRNEAQQVSIIGESGHFNLTFLGQKTIDLSWDASAAEVKAALEALSTVGSGGIAGVTKKGGAFEGTRPVYDVTFGGQRGESNLGQMTGGSGADPLIDSNNYPSHKGSVRVTNLTQGGNSAPIAVEAHLTGLTPGATYHFKLVATNGAGTASSADGIFVPTLEPAQPPCPNEIVRKENNSLALPECRAYEQVSAPNKGGFPVYFESNFEGESVVYGSSAANINNSGQATTLGSTYIAVRTSSGWETVPNLNGPTGSLFSNGTNTGNGLFRPLVYSQNLRSQFLMMKPGAQYPQEIEPHLREPDGSFTQVGTTLEGRGGQFQEVVGATPDLSHLVLDSGGAGGPFGPGVYEFVGTGTGLPHRVDLDDSGQPVSECPVNPATGKALSRDGRTIFFLAFGNCGADGPPVNELWARVGADTNAPHSYFASQSHCTRLDCNAPASPSYRGSALDGSSIFFTTTQQLVNEDADQGEDLYVYRLPTAAEPNPSLTEVSGLPGGSGLEAVEGVSDDGSTALFVASGVLAGNEDALEETAQAGDHNLYLWRRDAGHPAGQTMFLGRLPEAYDLSRAFQGPGGTPYEIAQLTPDGRYAAFSTTAQLLPTDTDTARDLYRYDVGADKLTRLSTTVSGTGGNVDGADATFGSTHSQTTPIQFFPLRMWTSNNQWISDDGSTVVFSTNGALSPLDGNGVTDVYLWKDGHVHLISPGAAGDAVDEPYLDASGQNVYFETNAPLSPNDGDSVRDVYDARIGGGFSAAAPIPCAGEACQPAGPGAPSSPSPATDRPLAAEPAPEKSCPKGKVLKKGKCVKKPPKKHHKNKHQKGKRSAKGKRGGAK